MKRKMTKLYPAIRCNLCFWHSYLSYMNERLSYSPSLNNGRTVLTYPTVNLLWYLSGGGRGQERKKNKLYIKAEVYFNLSFAVMFS